MDALPNSVCPTIRPTVRAVIIKDGKILVQLKEKQGQSPYLTLPGGKQEPGETVIDTLRRECAEEVAAEVEVGELLHVAEVFKPKAGEIQHRLELLFACTVADDYVPVMGPEPDSAQIGTAWVPLSGHKHEFRPRYGQFLANSSPKYLGVLNG